MNNATHNFHITALLLFVSGCAAKGDLSTPPIAAATVYPAAETAPAPSIEDAADDPAIWVSPADPGKSLVLGTDKQTGLYVYDLSGALVQSLAIGPLNNVDLRPGRAFDVAVASNDGRNVVNIFAINHQTGAVAVAGEFASGKIEPYGICIGDAASGYLVAVTYKDGTVQLFEMPAAAPAQATLSRTYALSSQLEGCVFDETHQRLFVGEEAKGVWSIDYAAANATPVLVDAAGSASGLIADVEGVSLWRDAKGGGYLVVAAQGASRFIVYDRTPPFTPRGAFVIGATQGADAVTGTDGLDITSANLGPSFPNGLLVVQDDVNSDPAANQNFKYVDLREIERALTLGDGAINDVK